MVVTMATDIARVDRRALHKFIEYADDLWCKLHPENTPKADRDADSQEFRRYLTALGVLTEPGSDELLASVMRKLLAEDMGYANWGHQRGRSWVTIDVQQMDITAEEMQAIDEAAPSS